MSKSTTCRPTRDQPFVTQDSRTTSKPHVIVACVIVSGANKKHAALNIIDSFIM